MARSRGIAEPSARPADEPVVRALLPRQLSDPELVVFSHAGAKRNVERGELIFRRGELGRSMFVIGDGQIRLEFGNGLSDKVIGAREFFGELALFIGNHARVASAVAVERSTLYVIEHAAFERLLGREPGLLAAFMVRSFAYLVASEQQLIASLKRRNEDLLVTIDSLRQTQSQLSAAERLVQTDELTGLCNRRGLYGYLDRLAEQRVPGTRIGLLLVDIDRFKQINDSHGHLMGDQVLRAISQEVQQACSACDLPCRLGGDEFAVLAQVGDADELELRAAQLVQGVRSLRFPEPFQDLRVTVSVGGALCAESGDWSDWYSTADVSLYQSKGTGGDGWRADR
ncbi:MAG TPA: GGDEF domain-containing protein [Candidatus Saccharimonadia bacterium]|nr:GGDEF domain-containing protein [Candidatus Saccharimonadia bacterium]